MKARQASAAPTRKLTAATLAAALVEVARVTTENIAPDWADASMWHTLLPVVVFLCGYLVKDNANIPEDGES